MIGYSIKQCLDELCSRRNHFPRTNVCSSPDGEDLFPIEVLSLSRRNPIGELQVAMMVKESNSTFWS